MGFRGIMRRLSGADMNCQYLSCNWIATLSRSYVVRTSTLFMSDNSLEPYDRMR